MRQFASVPMKVLLDGRLSFSARFIYSVAKGADESPTCVWIAEQTGIPEYAVFEHVQALVEAGHVTVVEGCIRFPESACAKFSLVQRSASVTSLAIENKVEEAKAKSRVAAERKREKRKSRGASVGLQSIAGEGWPEQRGTGSKNLEKERASARRKAPGAHDVEDWFRREVKRLYGDDKLRLYQRWGSGELKRAGDLVAENGMETTERMVVHFCENMSRYGFDGFPTIFALWSCRNRVAGELCGLVGGVPPKGVRADGRRRGFEDEFSADHADGAPEVGW